MPDRFFVDKASSTWLAVRQRVDAERERLLEELSTDGISERKADSLRGRLAAMKWLLSIPADQERELQGADEDPPSY